MKRVRWLHGRDRMRARCLALLGLVVVVGGCQRPAPPEPPEGPEPEVAGTSGDPASTETPIEADTATPPDQPVEVEEGQPAAIELRVSEGPVSGLLDDEPFVLKEAKRQGNTLIVIDASGRSVSIVAFDELVAPIEIVDERVPFGSPHVFVRNGVAASPMVYTDAYRLLLDVDAGTIWLELPDGRGVISGHFEVQ